ncbi:MAG: UPF0175 family protein [Bryobacterales bacterium]
MALTIDIPDDISEILAQRWGDLSRRVIETMALEAYAEDLLTEHQLGRLLGLPSRFDVEAFLKQRRVPSGYTNEDLDEDVRRLRQAETSGQ